MNNNYQAVIGLEIHAELSTATKMFCRCKNDPFHSEANTNVCPVCLGLPGALPVANEEAIKATIMVGLALHCTIATHSKFDRKNYFYPDLPKGYQISQYDLPLCAKGYLSAGDTKVAVTRIHLEEDTGTLQHPAGAQHSLVSYNRSGVPLLELVTEPDIRTGKEARLFAEEYQRILRSLGVADADMEKGGMRVEANISIRTHEQAEANEYGTKVEVKNLNSFRSVEKAINFELDRQAEALTKGEAIVQETRGWHDEKQITFSQRIKEGSADYRYFPEPDLPPLEFTFKQIDDIAATMPELPNARRERYLSLELPAGDVEVLANDLETAAYFEALLSEKIPAKLAANWTINDAADRSVEPKRLAELLRILNAGEISTKIAKDVLVEMKLSGKAAAVVIEEKGLKQVSDTGAIESMIDAVLAANADQVAAYKAGKEQLFGFFVGQIMKEAKGQANPQLLNELLKKKLS